MADGEVLISTKIDTKEAEADLKKLKKELKEGTKAASESAGKMDKAFEDVDASKVADGLSESVKEEAQKAEKTVDELAAELPETVKDAYSRIQAIRENDSTDQKTKAAQIAGEYKKLGQTSSDAMKNAWAAVKADSESGSRKVIDDLQDIAREARQTGSTVDSGLGDKLEGLASKVPSGDMITGALFGVSGALSEKAIDLLAKAAEKLVELGKAAIEAAADVQAANAQFEQTFDGLENRARDALEEVAEDVGISATRLEKSYSKIYAFSKNAGASTKQAMDISGRAIKAAADNAAYFDVSVEDATETLQSFLKGNYENDAALNISATETTRNTMANKLYAKSFVELSESQKVETLLAMVEAGNKASGAMGQAAREADSWTSVTGELSEAWNQFLAIMGADLLEDMIPILQGITYVLKDYVDLNKELIASKNGIADSMTEVELAAEDTANAVQALRQSYDEAREAAKKSIEQQIGLLTELETKSDKSAKEIVDNWKKQQAALQNYSKNLQKAIDMGLDEALVQQLSDGSQESMQILNEFVNGTGISVEDINREFQGVQKSKEIVSATMADIQTGTSRKLQQIAQDTKNQWGDMADVVGASVADMQEYIDSLTGRQVYVDVIGRYNGSAITNAYGNAFGGGYNPYSFTGYSVDATSYVPYLAEGAVIPPNAPFTAVLGDQRNGYNLEGPEEMFRSIVREELGSASSEETNELLWGILQAIQSSRVISINGREVFEEMVDENNRAIQSYGRSPLR